VVFALHEWTWVKSPNSTWNNVGSIVEISVGRNSACEGAIAKDTSVPVRAKRKERDKFIKSSAMKKINDV
jgi:hypothetical protein